jgi:hypothetical protein
LEEGIGIEGEADGSGRGLAEFDLVFELDDELGGEIRAGDDVIVGEEEAV